MAKGDKSSYTGKQKRQAEHIAEGYEERGTPESEAERIAWATVNKQDGGGKKSGSSSKSSSKAKSSKSSSKSSGKKKTGPTKRKGAASKTSKSK